MILIRCRLLTLIADHQPPWLEAYFNDAHGRLIRIHGKEPMFRDDSDPPDQGWVRGTEQRREGNGPAARVWVSLVEPDMMETTEGEESVEVWASETAPPA